jgi:hypothetical protein
MQASHSPAAAISDPHPRVRNIMMLVVVVENELHMYNKRGALSYGFGWRVRRLLVRWKESYGAIPGLKANAEPSDSQWLGTKNLSWSSQSRQSLGTSNFPGTFEGQ